MIENIKYMMTKIPFLIFTVCFIFSLVAGTAFSSGMVKAGGMLTAIERDRNVIIDRKGYLVTSSTKIVDLMGRRISLRGISLPVHVDFRYEHTPAGAVIRVLRICPEPLPK
jgi:hypothetical protein